VKVFLSFAGGFVGSAIVIYVTCQLGFEYVSSVRGPVASERRAFQGILMVTVMGALLCGALCAGAAQRPARRPHPGARMSPPPRAVAGPLETPLTQEEFERVARAVLWRDLAARDVAYLQGLLVGCFQDTAPGLAAKIDGFSEAHLAALREDLHRYRRQLV
jgi:hypothetical protein